MKETFYQQIRELGIMIKKATSFEAWMVRGCLITIYFKDDEHHVIDTIIL